MRGGYPSQTLPFAGGQPPTPPGSVSPLHHDQRPALDPLIHHADIHKTSSQTSPPRPGPMRRPIAVPCTKPLVPGQNCRRKLRAQTIAAAIQKAPEKPRRRQTRAALHGSFLTRSGPPLTVREHQHKPDQHTPRRRQAFEGHRLGRLHGSFLTRSASQPTTARQPWLPGNPARPSAARFLARAGPGLPVFKDDQTPPVPCTDRRRRTQNRTQSHAQTRSGTQSTPSTARRRPERGAQLAGKPSSKLNLHRPARAAMPPDARPNTDAYAGGAPHGSFLARSAPRLPPGGFVPIHQPVFLAEGAVCVSFCEVGEDVAGQRDGRACALQAARRRGARTV